MSKKKLSAMSAKAIQNEKSGDLFKFKWLKVKVTANARDFRNMDVELSSIYK